MSPRIDTPMDSIDVTTGEGPYVRDSIRGTVPVLYLIPTLDRGGAEGQLISLINGLDRQRFTPLLCCLEMMDHAREHEVRCEQLSLGMRSLFRPTAAHSLLRIVRLIRRHRVLVVHACFLRAEVLAAAAKLAGAGIKVVLGKRDLEHYRYRRHERWLTRSANAAADVIVGNAGAVRARLETTWRVPPRKIEVISNGVDLERFLPVGPDDRVVAKRRLGFEGHETVVLIVTHLTDVKAVDTFISAAAAVSREAKSTRFLVVGNGPLLDVLVSQARSLGMERTISFAGEVADVTPYLAAADVGVLSSRSEAFPNAILEYLATGLPVVSTDVGGVAEILGTDDGCGFRVSPGASAMMAKRLATLIECPELRLQMGARGRRRAQALFGVDRMVTAYECLYGRLTADPRRG
jgi:L-malate glycosyltransferase